MHHFRTLAACITCSPYTATSLVNFTGFNFLRLQKPNHASHLTAGGIWYQCVYCLNLSHSQRGKVCCTNCTRQLSTLYWIHHMTHQLHWNDCAGCMRERSLLSRCPSYIVQLIWLLHISSRRQAQAADIQISNTSQQ
jgi:hypothetical protein